MRITLQARVGFTKNNFPLQGPGISNNLRPSLEWPAETSVELQREPREGSSHLYISVSTEVPKLKLQVLWTCPVVPAPTQVLAQSICGSCLILTSRRGPKADAGGCRDAPQLTSGATGHSGALLGWPGLGPSKGELSSSLRNKMQIINVCPEHRDSSFYFFGICHMPKMHECPQGLTHLV